jgi:prepilin-type N-terminal cleavage/methylation domain-containing protein/prepilin-type processing-associated H-X9-DG protein
MKRNAFTLIELLVVIAIIAILAAILFPVFARARAKAMQAACISNMKQIALAEKMYCADYNDMWCTAGWWGVTRQDALQPYMKNTQIFTCPSVPRGWEAERSYIFNMYEPGNQGFAWAWTSESTIPAPAEVVMWGDGLGIGWAVMSHALYMGTTSWTAQTTPAMDSGLTADPAYWPWWDSTGYIGQQMPLACFSARHNGLCDFNYADGHAKAQKLILVIAPSVVFADWPSNGTTPQFRSFQCAR